ncbi:hypothetical protein ABDK00_017060 [Niabella insulamsoli]|uniref:hypothetical protein n=1 Tax=Niabella insulamsoli TaxID=3144874 RepID=UPI0031FC58B9
MNATITKQKNTVQEQICQLLGWTDEEYSQYIYENGLQYLRQLLPEAPQLAAKLESSRMFWNWFKRMFNEMDALLVDPNNYNLGDLQCRYQLYHAVHCPFAVAAERRPPRCVWDDVLHKCNTKRDWRDVLIEKIQAL